MTSAQFSASVAVWLMAEWLNKQLTQLNRKADHIMAQVAVEQGDLDTLAAQLETVRTSLANEIADLQAANPALPTGSLDGLKTALSDLQSLQPPTPGPVTETPPAETPPADTGTPTDTGATDASGNPIA